jgi:uncharacterized protein (DUF849 family)
MTGAAIAVAPNGARRGKTDHPALPLTPAELAADARRCVDAGAAMMHLHVRRADGSHSLEPQDYLPAIDAIRAAVGDALVLQLTTEAVGVYTPGQQMACVCDLRPEAVSIALRELFVEPDTQARAFVHWLERERIVAQYILYDSADLQHYRRLRADRTIGDGTHWVLFVLGRYRAGQTSSPHDLLPFIAEWGDAATPWAMCAFGRHELACAGAALAFGGHVRVGFENNLWRADGSVASGNAELVGAAAGVARALAREPLSADGLRALFSR